jgi:hypothetical protein
MHVIRARFSSVDPVVEQLDDLFVPTRDLLDPRTPVLLRLRCPDLDVDHFLRARVIANQRRVPRLGIRRGIRVAIERGGGELLGYLTAIAKGERFPIHGRRHPRLPVD